MRLSSFIAALAIGCMSFGMARADLIVSASPSVAAVNTIGGFQDVNFVISLRTSAGTQGVLDSSLKFVVVPSVGGVTFPFNTSAAAGSPAVTGFTFYFPDSSVQSYDDPAGGPLGFTFNAAGSNVVNVTLRFAQGVGGVYTLGLLQSQSAYHDLANVQTQYANSYIGGVAALATVTAVGIPEAGACMFGGLATVIGGAFAWRRKSQVA